MVGILIRQGIAVEPACSRLRGLFSSVVSEREAVSQIIEGDAADHPGWEVCSLGVIQVEWSGY